jgi:DNA-binding protein WhiA
MSLSDELRDELASIAPVRRCCRLAELSALCHAAGSWHLHGRGELGVHLDLSSAAAARRAFALFRDLGVRSEIRTYHRRAFDRATRYQLHVEADAGAVAMLREAGVLSASGAPLELPPKRVVGRSCCVGAYLRGALLGAGSLSGPKGPHLELRATTREGAELLAALAAREGVTLKVVERPTHAAAYAKGGETIADLLALAGASETALRLDEHAVLAATRAEANRLANADEANVKRTVTAAQRQLDAIGRLDLESLPRGLYEIAALRLRHPELSLAELAARCRPPITKAAAHHRMATIVRKAEEGELRGRTPPLRFHARTSAPNGV